MDRRLPPPVSPAVPMAATTMSVVQALSALNHKVPDVGLALLEARMSADSQRQFAWLMLEVAEANLLHANKADGQSVYPDVSRP